MHSIYQITALSLSSTLIVEVFSSIKSNLRCIYRGNDLHNPRDSLFRTCDWETAASSNFQCRLLIGMYHRSLFDQLDACSVGHGCYKNPKRSYVETSLVRTWTRLPFNLLNALFRLAENGPLMSNDGDSCIHFQSSTTDVQLRAERGRSDKNHLLSLLVRGSHGIKVCLQLLKLEFFTTSSCPPSDMAPFKDTLYFIQSVDSETYLEYVNWTPIIQMRPLKPTSLRQQVR